MENDQKDNGAIEGEKNAAPADGDEMLSISKTENEKLKSERDEYLAGWQRERADYLNFKKEEGKRLEEYKKFSLVDIAYDLIPVLDSFEAAKEAIQDEKLQKELMRLQSQLVDILRKRGLEELETEEGAAFDPGKHEAVESEESEKEKGTILKVLQKGYMLNNKIIRPARVIVAK